MKLKRSEEIVYSSRFIGETVSEFNYVGLSIIDVFGRLEWFGHLGAVRSFQKS